MIYAWILMGTTCLILGYWIGTWERNSYLLLALSKVIINYMRVRIRRIYD